MIVELEEKVLHFKKPAKTSRGTYDTHRMILVSCKENDGALIGVGECAPLPDLSCDRDAYSSLGETKKLVEDAIASGNADEYLRNFPALAFALSTASSGYGNETPFLRGERGLPINGLVWMSDFDDMLSQVKQKIESGFRCIKIKIGSIDWNEEIKLLSLIRSSFSKEDLELRVDANGAFKPEEAMAKLEELAIYDLHSIEQPIRQGNWYEMANLCRKTPVPIALDEELIGVNMLEDKKKLLDVIMPQYIIIKPTLLGLKGAEEWIEEANKRQIPSWITSSLESNIGLRHVAIFSEKMYGDNMMPQGLGTGLLFADNIPSDIEIRGSKLWIRK